MFFCLPRYLSCVFCLTRYRNESISCQTAPHRSDIRANSTDLVVDIQSNRNRRREIPRQTEYHSLINTRLPCTSCISSIPTDRPMVKKIFRITVAYSYPSNQVHTAMRQMGIPGARAYKRCCRATTAHNKLDEHAS